MYSAWQHPIICVAQGLMTSDIQDDPGLLVCCLEMIECGGYGVECGRARALGNSRRADIGSRTDLEV